MIIDLSYKASFASSGFTLDRHFQPQTGITAVVGPNGSGKTASTIELIRWLLFGSKARRGKSDDYKNASGQGTFIINGSQYTIKRGPRREEIVDDADGTVLAVNAEAVNAKVIEKLGYGLAVFDVCNASVQGKTQLFGAMRPTERKRMIDQVVGLTSNEAVEKACRAEATVLRREVEALSKALVAPVGPEQPSGYRTSDLIEIELQDGRTAKKRYDEALSQIKPVAVPVRPSFNKPALVEITALQNDEDERRSVERRRASLEAFIKEDRPTPMYTAEQLDQAEVRLRKRKLIDAAGPQPTMTADDIEQAWREWTLYDAHVVSDEVTCPNCDHMFRPTGEAPLEPEYSKLTLREQTKRIGAWMALTPDLPDGVDLTDRQIKTHRAVLVSAQNVEEAQQELARLPILLDRSSTLNTLRERLAAWTAYEAALVEYEKQMEVNLAAQDALDKMEEPPSEEQLGQLAEDLSVSRIYESQWAAYDKAKIAFEAQSAVIEDKRKLAEEFKKGGDALADARATIKAYLAPALSRVASTLIFDMTNGKMQSVIVDEDMEISVDGQTLDTLSGGGQTVANLALRIALGRVLVADTFPVFLGDEMDADIDNARREAIADALVGLKDHLKQIILITHRDVGIADHVLDLTNT